MLLKIKTYCICYINTIQLNVHSEKDDKKIHQSISDSSLLVYFINFYFYFEFSEYLEI
jgi:hypothetical protein